MPVLSNATFEIISRTIIFDGGTALFPGIALAQNGDLLVAFCSSGDIHPGGECFLVCSSDLDRSWSPSVLLASPKQEGWACNLSVGLHVAKDGAVLYPFYEGINWDSQYLDREGKVFCWRSLDHGKTWTDRAPIPCDLREPWAYGRIVEVEAGTLLLPLWGSKAKGERWRTGLLKSYDGGKTWPDYRTIGLDDAQKCPGAGFNETSLILLPDSTVLALIRQSGVGGGGTNFYRAVSRDGGDTWSAAERLALHGTSPSLHQTPSGRLIAGYRRYPIAGDEAETQLGVAISSSEDGGKSWREELILEDPKGFQYTSPGQAGYPAFENLPDGRVIVAFYTTDASGRHYVAANLLREL